MLQLRDSPPWGIALCVLAMVVVARLYRRLYELKARSRGLPVPPGPTPLPFIGNLLDLPKSHPWRTYRDYSRQYGKIISLNAMGQRVVVIDDPDVAVELLEKRSAIYSSRPQSVTIELLVQLWVGDWNLSILPYGPRWRLYRRTFWQHFRPVALSKYHWLQENGARRLLTRLLSPPSPPNDLLGNIRDSLGEVLIRGAYGLQTADTGDKYIATFEEVIASLDLLLTGTQILEFFPFLARFPTWMPGTASLRRMAHYRALTVKIREIPWADAKNAIIAGTASDSMASAMFEETSHSQGENRAAQEDTVKNVLAIAYAGDVNPQTHSALSAFFVAMSLHPDVQRKAQAELDAVVGEARFPKVADRDRLPYVNAVVKELLRWHVVTPLSVPHQNIADDEYDGHFIPKGSVVLVNAWSMLHDEEEYPEPERFIPERFLQDGKLRSDIRDPATIAFGFGRRICPGRYFAEATLFIYIASVLLTFDIKPPVDENGQPIRIDVNVSSGLVSRIEDCRCTVKPRSTAAQTLIRGADST
ncbi:cytochrome P450 [Daedaleopsis nitida]|nr:cytochrome P450 [Daedaleopsis nitida]